MAFVPPQTSAMEELPTEILTRVLGFLDIPSRIKLARGNTSFQQRVYRECSPAWETIDLSGTFRLTDAALSTLLTTINARQVTKALNVTNCDFIRGDGLFPLRGSRVLEVASICPSVTDHDARPFLSILRTCIPYNLRHVGMSATNANSESGKEFLRHLREAKFLEGQEKGTLCDSCQQPLVDVSMQTVPSIRGIPAQYCVGCKKEYCRRGSCPVDVRECCSCADTTCALCEIIAQCNYCGKSYCKEFCGGLFSCEECSKFSCDDCEAILYCCCCNEAFICRGCGNNSDLPSCTFNRCLFCNECWRDGRCNVCNSHVCFDCDGYRLCTGCSNIVCRSAACEETFKTCGVSGCKHLYCSDCDLVEQCGGCSKNFCISHAKLVFCEKCDMRHCRACRYVERCKYCDTACYEECLCSESRPSKKAKTS